MTNICYVFLDIHYFNFVCNDFSDFVIFIIKYRTHVIIYLTVTLFFHFIITYNSIVKAQKAIKFSIKQFNDSSLIPYFDVNTFSN